MWRKAHLLWKTVSAARDKAEDSYELLAKVENDTQIYEVFHIFKRNKTVPFAEMWI